MIVFLLLLIYISFLVDFLVFPIPSEASTVAVSRQYSGWTPNRIILWLAYAVILVTWLFPLVFSIFYIHTENTVSPGWVWSGFLLAVSGRVITCYASYQIRAGGNQLVDTGLFAWTRHPIVCGLHITLAGVLLTTGEPLLILPYIFTLFYFDYKIDIEEKAIIQVAQLNYQQYCIRCSRYPLNTSGFNWHTGSETPS